MDFLTQQFIATAKRLREQLNVIREGIFTLLRDSQGQITAIREDRNTQNERDNTPPVLRAELHVPHPIEVQTSPKDKKQGREWFTLVVETLTLIGVVVYATVAIRQWREMISARHQTREVVWQAARAANEAHTANDITKEALVSVQRAYIFADSSEVSTVSDETGKTIALVLPIKLQNSGSTPTRRMKNHLSWQYQDHPLPDNFAFPDSFSVGRPKVDAFSAIGPQGHHYAFA